jgi:PAS domain S-box-containing protein
VCKEIRRFGYVLCFWLAIVPVVAQTTTVDSLRTLLQTEKNDTIRVVRYNELAREIAALSFAYPVADKRQYFEDALLYADSGLLLSRDVVYQKGEIDLNCTIGVIYYHANKFDEAIRYYEISYEIASQYGTAYDKAVAIYNMGLAYMAEGKFVQSLEYLNLASSLFKDVDNEAWIQDINANTSLIYRQINKPELAIEYGKIALEIAQRRNDANNSALIYANLAESYMDLHDTATSAKFYETAIRYYHNMGNYYQEATLLSAHAVHISDPKKSLELLSESSKLHEQTNPNSFALAGNYKRISGIYKKIGERDSAMHYQGKALQIALLSANPSIITETYIWLGEEALDASDLNKAEHCFLLARKYNKKTGSSIYTVGILNNLSETYKRKGDHRRMFEMAQAAANLSDSLMVIEDNRRLGILQIQYELRVIQEKEELAWQMQAEKQNQNIRRRRNIILVLLSVALIIIVSAAKLISSFRAIRKKNKLLQTSHEEMLLIQEQLRLSNDELDMYKKYLEEMVLTKAAEQARKDMQLYGLSNNLPGGFIYRKIVHADGNEQLSYISSNVKKMYGVSSDTLIGRGNFYSVWDANEDGLVEKLKEKEAACAEKMLPFKYEFSATKDGETIWLLTCSFPHAAENGSIIWDGFVIDISKQKEAEHTLNIAKEKAEEADLQKSVFLSNMSHEIRTPMNAIMGFIGFVENENLPPAKRSLFIKTIRKSVDQLLSLVENIIDISKLEIQQLKIYPAEFALNDLMKELEDFFIPQIPPNKALYFQFDDSQSFEHDHIYNDRARIKQILLNLIENAIKYTEKGVVRFGYQQADDPDEVLFFVEDTGIGIPEDQQEIIFEYFRQSAETELKPKYGGIGLGLSISKGLIECTKGRIWVKSTLNEGSTFFLTMKKRLEPETTDG